MKPWSWSHFSFSLKLSHFPSLLHSPCKHVNLNCGHFSQPSLSSQILPWPGPISPWAPLHPNGSPTSHQWPCAASAGILDTSSQAWLPSFPDPTFQSVPALSPGPPSSSLHTHSPDDHTHWKVCNGISCLASPTFLFLAQTSHLNSKLCTQPPVLRSARMWDFHHRLTTF